MKSKEVGAEQKKRAYWQGHIQSWQQSGLSQADFCKVRSLALSTFTYWRRKINQGNEGRPRFYPLAVMPSLDIRSKEQCPGLRLIIGEKRFLVEVGDNFSEQALKRLIITLEQL